MFLSAILAAAVAAQPTPTVSTEMLGINVPDEFRVGYHQRTDTEEIIELVQPPETVDDWSKLVTSLMFFGAAQTGLDAAGARWAGEMRRGCPGMKEASDVRGTVDRHPALRYLISCPENPQTRKPENLTAVLVQGDANLMMAQVAFRHALTAPDTALIGRIVGSLKWCDQRSLNSCRARKATGFVATP